MGIQGHVLGSLLNVIEDHISGSQPFCLVPLEMTKCLHATPCHMSNMSTHCEQLNQIYCPFLNCFIEIILDA